MNNKWENKAEDRMLAGKKAAFLSLGCKVNSYETQAMTELFKKAGAEIVEFQEKADIYVVNTCTVTNIADRKSRQMLHRARHLNPDAAVVAAGCYAQAAGEVLLSDGAVDLIVGNNRKKEIVPIVAAYLNNADFKNALSDIGTEKQYEDLTIDSVTEKVRAYIKVQDGCNQFCSYCIIPYARGRIRSREKDSVVEEVKRLASGGYREIVLTGIHLSSYGLDRGKEGLSDLIVSLCRIEGIERIRLGSLEPRIITEDFVKTLSEESKVCPHFHLSLQSGCDTVLKRMNRKYTTAEYLEKCELLRRRFDLPALTTDVITGFPGETDEEFEITKEFLKKAAFAQMHIFKYSRREGTVAAKMAGQVPEPVKAQRSDRLIALGEELKAAYRAEFAGQDQKILVEETAEIEGLRYAVGHNERYVKFAVRTEDNLEKQIITAIAQKKSLNDMILCEIRD